MNASYSYFLYKLILNQAKTSANCWVTITLGTLAQGRLGNTIFYLFVVEKVGSTEWVTIKMLRRCSKCFGHLAKWLENRKGESNNNLLLRLGVGGPQFFHYFLVVCMYISLGSPEKQNQTNRISLSLSLSPPPLPLSLSPIRNCLK